MRLVVGKANSYGPFLGLLWLWPEFDLGYTWLVYNIDRYASTRLMAYAWLAYAPLISCPESYWAFYGLLLPSLWLVLLWHLSPS